MGSTLVTLWDEIQVIVDALVPQGRNTPLYRMLEDQVDQPGSAWHRRYWYDWSLTTLVNDRGLELSEVEYEFELKMFFDFQQYQKKTFERIIVDEPTNIWRAIESNDIWGTGIQAVQVTDVSKETLDNNDVIVSISIFAMCDET